MRDKKWLTIITFYCFAFALLVTLHIGKKSASIIYDISMAVFGSALLGFIISLIEYIVERRNAMELFWDEARKALISLRKYKYINTDAPTALIQACFQEESSNGFAKYIGPSIKEEAKDALISWYEENNHVSWNEGDDIGADLEEIYTQQMKYYRDSYMKCIDSCIEVASIDLGMLGNAYSNLDFIFCNKCIRYEAYTNIYSKIIEYQKLALNEHYHFSQLKTGKGNFPICANKAHDICKRVFHEENRIESGFESKVVYQTAFDDIDEALEKFRCKTYRKAEPNSLDRIPILGNTHIINFEKSEL